METAVAGDSRLEVEALAIARNYAAVAKRLGGNWRTIRDKISAELVAEYQFLSREK